MRLQPIHSYSVSGPDYFVFLPSCPCSLRRENTEKENKSKNQKNPTAQLFFLKPLLFLYIPFFLLYLWCKHVTLDGLLFHIQQQPCPSPSHIQNWEQKQPHNGTFVQSLSRTTFSDYLLQPCSLLLESYAALSVCSTNKRLKKKSHMLMAASLAFPKPVR